MGLVQLGNVVMVTTSQLKWLCMWQFSNCGPFFTILPVPYTGSSA